MMVDLKRIAFDNGLGQKELGEVLGIAQSQVSLMVNGRRDITQAHIDLLIAHFGKETIAKYIIDDEVAELIRTPQAKQVTATLIPAETVEEVKEELIEGMSIPVISPDVANKINFDVRVYIEENTGELEHINPTELLKDADAAERVLRGAMQPTFIPSDVVFIRFLRNKAKIIDGNIYYFDLKSRPTMIRKVKIEGDKLRLIAENPEFGDVITDFSDILNVADIVGMFRTSFSTQYSEIEAMRRKKDEQIENLITEMGRAGNRQDKMIEQISKLVQHALEKK